MKSPECYDNKHDECIGTIGVGSALVCDCNCHGGGSGVREPIKPLTPSPSLKVLVGV